ncbi:hypothetical protein [Sporosarcina saromensis]|uniref:hypothetical protein n=1 Tax=Sporosarcina saromensis TaxID=359365 RepID=UPI00295EC6BE|nr:hypothetical protein [Sporosarcina saromensis]
MIFIIKHPTLTCHFPLSPLGKQLSPLIAMLSPFKRTLSPLNLKLSPLDQLLEIKIH